VGDDVVAKCINNLKKAALDTQKGANLGLKCVRMRTRWGSLSAPPDPLVAIGGCLLLRGREGKGMEN